MPKPGGNVVYSQLHEAYRLTRAASRLMEAGRDAAALKLVRQAVWAASKHVKEWEKVLYFGLPPEHLLEAEALIDRLLAVQRLLDPEHAPQEVP